MQRVQALQVQTGGSLADLSFHSSIAFVRCDSAVWNRLPLAVACVFFQIIHFPTPRVVPVSYPLSLPLVSYPSASVWESACVLSRSSCYQFWDIMSCGYPVMGPCFFLCSLCNVVCCLCMVIPVAQILFFPAGGQGLLLLHRKIVLHLFSSSIFTFFLSFCYFKFRFKLISA